MSVVELAALMDNVKSILDKKIKEASTILGVAEQELYLRIIDNQYQTNHTSIEICEASEEDELTIVDEDSTLSQPVSDNSYLPDSESINANASHLNSSHDSVTPTYDDRNSKTDTIELEDKSWKDNDSHTEINNDFCDKSAIDNNDIDSNSNNETYNNMESAPSEFPILTRLSKKSRKKLSQNGNSFKTNLILKPVRRNTWNFTWSIPLKDITRTGNTYVLKEKETQWGRIVSAKGVIPTIMKGGTTQILITKKQKVS